MKRPGKHAGPIHRYDRLMQQVEINLKVPSLTIRASDKPDQRVDNRHIRFTKRITVETVPTAGDWLELSMHGESFHCTVQRKDWHEEKNLFVVECVFGRRTITEAELEGFMSDPDWATKQLP